MASSIRGECRFARGTIPAAALRTFSQAVACWLCMTGGEFANTPDAFEQVQEEGRERGSAQRASHQSVTTQIPRLHWFVDYYATDYISSRRPAELSSADDVAVKMGHGFAGVRTVIDHKAVAGIIHSELLRDFSGFQQ